MKLDRFQVEAAAALDAGRSVLVTAPTGSGKTMVAYHGIARALAEGSKSFYTTPLKALSNQKRHELAERFGEVGLLTGDSSILPGAPVVVMTTEVLRNMLLAGSPLLENLSTVILDEVHYLQDPYRGGVWEEVLILTPPDVRFVCLSATVGNPRELVGWLRSIRGDTALVSEAARPIVLRHHLLRQNARQEIEMATLLADGKLTPEAARWESQAAGQAQLQARNYGKGRGAARGASAGVSALRGGRT